MYWMGWYYRQSKNGEWKEVLSFFVVAVVVVLVYFAVLCNLLFVSVSPGQPPFGWGHLKSKNKSVKGKEINCSLLCCINGFAVVYLVRFFRLVIRRHFSFLHKQKVAFSDSCRK
ncbi:hypothetical protein QBC44DRAFT_321005 [Cladorrhinum sp. PSN332]|nr:hypothetical protein QBC44DRAFT_321005 [Cladorrhinum sp. PSN332]